MRWPLRQCLRWSIAQPGKRSISVLCVDTKIVGFSEVYYSRCHMESHASCHVTDISL